MKKRGRLRGIELLERHYSVNNNWTISKLYIELSSLMRVTNELCSTDDDVNTRKSKLNQLIREEREFLQKLIDSTVVEQTQVIIKTEKKEDFHEGDHIPKTPIKQEKTNTLLVQIPTTRSASKRSVKAVTSISDADKKPDQDGSMDVHCMEGSGNNLMDIAGDKDVAAASNPTPEDQQQELIIIPELPSLSNVGLASPETTANHSILNSDNGTVTNFMVVKPQDVELSNPLDDDHDDFVDDENDVDYTMDDDDDDDEADDAARSEAEAYAPKEPKGKSSKETNLKKTKKNSSQEGEMFRRKGQNFQCTECNEKFSKKMGINHHLKSHAVDSVNLCPHCGLSFEGQNLLERHFQLKHRNEPISNPNIDDKFICGGCPRIFTNLFHLKTHRSAEHHNKEYECEYCQEYFSNGNDHIKHLETHPYHCLICNETFDKKVLLDIHQNHIHEDEQYLHCPICHEHLKFFSDLAEHYGIHVNDDNAHVCFVCHRQFSTIDILYDHLHIHSVYKQVPCPNCPMRFKTVQAFIKHNDVIHKIVSENKGRCGGCGVIFKTKWLLKRHQQIEDEVTLKPCNECTMTFTCCRNLLTHKRSLHMTDVSGKKYVCDLCGKLFACSGTLKRHVVTHSGIKPYKCDVCNKSYTTDMGRKQHMASHLNLRRFQCHICSKQFNTNMHLKRHMKTHRAQRDFHCNICNKAFTQGGNLKVHQRIHTGVKPYKCQYCGKDFMYSGILNDHVKKHQQNYF